MECSYFKGFCGGGFGGKDLKKNNDVEAYKHKKETRENAVPVGLASYDTAKPKPKKYAYDPHLDNIKQQLLTATVLSNKGK